MALYSHTYNVTLACISCPLVQNMECWLASTGCIYHVFSLGYNVKEFIQISVVHCIGYILSKKHLANFGAPSEGGVGLIDLIVQTSRTWESHHTPPKATAHRRRHWRSVVTQLWGQAWLARSAIKLAGRVSHGDVMSHVPWAAMTSCSQGATCPELTTSLRFPAIHSDTTMHLSFARVSSVRQYRFILHQIWHQKWRGQTKLCRKIILNFQNRLNIKKSGPCFCHSLGIRAGPVDHFPLLSLNN